MTSSAPNGMRGSDDLRAGRLISINFDPSKRHEPAGRHYALMVSPWQVNRMSALTMVLTITSKNNGYPMHIEIAEGNPIHGFVQCEAIRAMDLESRDFERPGSVEIVGSIDDGTLSRCLACVKVVLGLEE